MGKEITVIDLNRKIGDGGDLSGLDKKLLEMASKRYSPDQMSDDLGGVISPARCAQRVKEILKSQDWLSIIEQQGVLMNDMVELKNILFDRVRDEGGITTDKKSGEEYWTYGDPRWSANLIRLMKEFREMINANRGEIDKQKDKIRQAHAAIFFRGMELAFDRFVFEVEKKIEDTGKAPTRAEMLLMMEIAMPPAFESIDEHVMDSE